MQLGFVSAILPDHSFEQVLSTAADLGYDCVEIMCWPVGKAERRYAGVTHIDAANLDEAGVAQIKELTEKYGVSLSGLGYYPNALSPDQEEADRAVEQIKHVIKATAQLGLTRMNTFIGRNWKLSVDENWPRFLETWKPILNLAEEHNVFVGIEHCPMLFSADEWPGGKNLVHSPKLWRRMFADIGSPNLGLNYDPSHMVWQHMDYLKPMREFADRIFHVHAKDVRIDQERLDDVGILAHPLEYHTPKLPGFGEVDWGKFFSVLGDTGYDGPVCVEVEDRAYEKDENARVASLVQSHTYLRNFIPKV